MNQATATTQRFTAQNGCGSTGNDNRTVEMPAPSINPLLVKSLALAGMATQVLDVVLTFAFGALHSDYSQVRDYISELAETGRPYAWLMNVWFVVWIVPTVGFAAAMYAGLPRSRYVTAGAVLYAVWAGLGIVGALFTCDPGCRITTWSARIHLYTGMVGIFCILPVPTLIWLGVRGHLHWRGFGRFTLAVQAAALVSLLLLGAQFYGVPGAGALDEVGGALQRVFMWTYYVWTIAVGVQLLHIADDEIGSSAPQS